MGDQDALAAQAARVRQQADALREANNKMFGDRQVEYGGQHDRLVRQSQLVRHEAEAAGAQADEHDKSAQQWRDMAKEFDDTAAQDAARGDSRAAEENREFAEGFRVNARAEEAQAEEARHEAGELKARADQLDEEAKTLESGFDAGTKGMAGEKAADALDEKARLMEEAAQLEQRADAQRTAGDTEGAAATEQQVTELWSKAEAITPDLSQLDPAVLQQVNTGTNDNNNNEPHTGGEEGDSSMGEQTTTIDTKAIHAEIDAEIEALRAQSKVLHEENQKRFVRGPESEQRDEDAAEAWGLRQKAKATERQVDREQSAADRAEKRAAESEAEAAKLEQTGGPAGRQQAEELRESAAVERAQAAENRQRAEVAKQRGDEANEKAAELEQKVSDFDSGKDMDSSVIDIEVAADSIDDKIRALQDAKNHFTDSDVMGGDEGMIKSGQEALAKARAMEPDLSKVPEDVRNAMTGAATDASTTAPTDGQQPEQQPGDGQEPQPQQPNAVDSDGDGLTDEFETRNWSRGLDPNQRDADNDTVDDGDELVWGTDPKNRDTDGDGTDDGRDLFPTDPKLYPGAPEENFRDHLRDLQQGTPQSSTVGDEPAQDSRYEPINRGADAGYTSDSTVGDSQYEPTYQDSYADSGNESAGYEDSASYNSYDTGDSSGTTDVGYSASSDDLGSGYGSDSGYSDSESGYGDSDSSYGVQDEAAADAPADDASYEYEG